MSIHTQPHPLSRLIGLLAVIQSTGSQWLPLLPQLMRSESLQRAEALVHIAGAEVSTEGATAQRRFFLPFMHRMCEGNKY